MLLMTLKDIECCNFQNDIYCKMHNYLQQKLLKSLHKFWEVEKTPIKIVNFNAAFEEKNHTSVLVRNETKMIVYFCSAL